MQIQECARQGATDRMTRCKECGAPTNSRSSACEYCGAALGILDSDAAAVLAAHAASIRDDVSRLVESTVAPGSGHYLNRAAFRVVAKLTDESLLHARIVDANRLPAESETEKYLMNRDFQSSGFAYYIASARGERFEVYGEYVARAMRDGSLAQWYDAPIRCGVCGTAFQLSRAIWRNSGLAFADGACPACAAQTTLECLAAYTISVDAIRERLGPQASAKQWRGGFRKTGFRRTLQAFSDYIRTESPRIDRPILDWQELVWWNRMLSRWKWPAEDWGTD
jgi:hypothetical protein